MAPAGKSASSVSPRSTANAEGGPEIAEGGPELLRGPRRHRPDLGVGASADIQQAKRRAQANWPALRYGTFPGQNKKVYRS